MTSIEGRRGMHLLIFSFCFPYIYIFILEKAFYGSELLLPLRSDGFIFLSFSWKKKIPIETEDPASGRITDRGNQPTIGSVRIRLGIIRTHICHHIADTVPDSYYHSSI